MTFSNTRALERDHGWSGICIDGNPNLIPALAVRRQCKVVKALVDSSTRKVTFAIKSFLGSGLSYVRRRGDSIPRHASSRQAMTVPLLQILTDLRAPPTIDFLSLDVEGSEEAVLAGFNFSCHTFRTIAVERPSLHLKHVLRNNSYTHLFDHGDYGDEFWVHSSLDSAARQRASDSTLRWHNVTDHPNWSKRRAGVMTGSKTKSSNNCCGVPASWIEASTVPPDDAPANDLVASGGRCKCP